MLEPTANNVSAIIVEEMMKWDRLATEEKRSFELTALSERLIRYFSVFYAQPVQLDGLPGGHALNPAESALGRRRATRSALMSGATGITGA